MNKRENSQWRIPKYRYQELRNFCLQYPDWQDEAREIFARTPKGEDPTGEDAVRLALLKRRSKQIVDTVDRTVEGLGGMSVWATLYQLVTLPGNEVYSQIAPDEIERYRELYKRFFWHLDKIHD
jgi:hypothetical protein